MEQQVNIRNQNQDINSYKSDNLEKDNSINTLNQNYGDKITEKTITNIEYK